MSRMFAAATLVTTLATSLLSSYAIADRAYEAPRFAQPPGAERRQPTQVDPPRIGLIAPVLDRASIRAALAQARRDNLAAFVAYQQRGVFPSNTFEPGRLNVWRDRDGHFCAAATIIRASGQDKLVDQVAEQNNFIRLGEVTQGPVMDWILTSGFTQDEIAMIQEPFSPITRGPSRSRPQPVDPDLRQAENDRLRARYTVVTKALVAAERVSLDAATERLMKHPQLAWQLL